MGLALPEANVLLFHKVLFADLATKIGENLYNLNIIKSNVKCKLTNMCHLIHARDVYYSILLEEYIKVIYSYLQLKI